MRFAVAGLLHESNSFIRGPTGIDSFEAQSLLGGILRGEAALTLTPEASSLVAFTRRARAIGHEVCPVLYAFAEPSAPIQRSVFDMLCEEIVSGIQRVHRQAALDGIYLELHGAMLSEDEDDGDALVVERVRARIPNVPLVATLDLHANARPRLLRACDAVVAYRTYPHVDLPETGHRALALLLALQQGRNRPCASWLPLPFMVPVNRQCTFVQPMRDVYAELERIERDDPRVLALSFTQGFQMADIEAPVPAVFAFATAQDAARSACARLGAFIAAREAQCDLSYVSVDDAVARVLAHSGAPPLLLADSQDNPGGGGSGETMFLLRALHVAGARGIAAGVIHDEAAASEAMRSGAGNALELSLGGRQVAGDQAWLARFEVVACRSDPVRLAGAMAGGILVDMGAMAWLRCDGVDVVVASRRTQCFDRGFFTHLGMDPFTKTALVLKSAVHFRADFEAQAAGVIDVLAPGFDVADVSKLPYTRLRSGIDFVGRAGQPRVLEEPTAVRHEFARDSEKRSCGLL
ncbi:MAG TPA: M81 family metallopeptidase [Rubrivivax sp.]|nr:M81 family metallopeptidase [Rubrivivax sp.]